jgi:ABC-2 type transport system ATP-binding protein
VEAFPGEIEAMSVSKPALEDVFIRRTGHKFWNEKDETELNSNDRSSKPNKSRR